MSTTETASISVADFAAEAEEWLAQHGSPLPEDRDDKMPQPGDELSLAVFHNLDHDEEQAVLDEIVEARGIETAFRQSLVSIRAKSREAVFRHLDEDREVVLPYDMIHVTPPQSAPDFVKRSALANEAGWVDVDKHTTQHVRFPNVFSLGDASSLPCSKTGAAIRKQAPVTARNVLDLRAGRELSGRYDGYASCPLVTGYGRVVLAEFGYDGKIMETFGVNQAKERFSMYALKAHALPSMYWHGMLQGRM